MKKEVIMDLLSKFEEACYSYEGLAYWSARDLQLILDYNRWENFLNAILKAKKACENADSKVEDHFRDTTKMVSVGSGAKRDLEDIALTRYACYLIAQNGDPSK